MAQRDVIAIDLGRRRLRAVLADANGSGLRVGRVLLADRPEHLQQDDPEATGAWIAERLGEAGFPKRAGVTFSLAREHVAIKRLTLPTSHSDELPEMTRLALQRDLPFDPETAVVDFVTLEGSNNATSVLAIAAPRAIIDAARRITRAAGLRLDHLSLRSMGSAALVVSESSRDENVLVVDMTSESVELTVVSNGIVTFSRAAELDGTVEAEAVVDAVLTETRRTWMSYRISEGAADVDRVVVLGTRSVAQPVADGIASMLKVPSRALVQHSKVEGDANDLASVWALTGLILAPDLDVETIDLAAPRKAPDRAGQRRQLMLVACGVVVTGLLALWTWGRMGLQDLQGELDTITGQRNALADHYATHVRERLQLEHLERWNEVRADWLEHLVHLETYKPTPNHLVLDRISGELQTSPVRYDKRAEDDKWSVASAITMTIDGEAVDRATADAFRAALVESDLYRQSSSGADARGGRRHPFGFTYRLHTTEAAPAPEATP